MAGGFTVDRAALRETAQGINDTIGALGKLGFDEEAEVGRGFSGLSLSGPQVGDAGLQAAFAGFCDRWSWGVRSLVQDGSQIAVRLGLTAGMYSDAEQSVIGAAKDVVDAGLGQSIRFGYDQAGRETARELPGGVTLAQQWEEFDPSSLEGLTLGQVRASIPSDWSAAPSKAGGGEVFRDPANPGRQIRIMPGYSPGARPDPLTTGPYAVISQNGVTVKVPLFGNPALP